MPPADTAHAGVAAVEWLRRVREALAAGDLPPKSTVHDYLTLWAWDDTLRRLHHASFVQARESA